jgi:AraC-like DNA-binding protein
MQVLKIENNTILLPFDTEDGFYYVYIKPTVNKNIKEWQKEYFLKVDLVRDVSGYSRYELHDMFKAFTGTASTKTFDIEQWASFLESFQYWVFNNFDIVI